jgi:hypothetical protein
VWEKDSFVYDEVEGDKFGDVYPMLDDKGLNKQGVNHKSFGVLMACDDSNNPEVSTCLSHLVALVVIKLRLVVALEIQLHLKLKENADITDIKAMIATQKCLLNKYLHMCHRKNKYILHIFSSEANVGFMRKQERPDSYSFNSSRQAFFVMDYYCRHFGRIPLIGAPDAKQNYLLTFLRGIGEMETPDLTYDR